MSELESPSQPTTEAEAPIVVAINITGDQVGAGFGKAFAIAIATVAAGRIALWEEHPVRWDIAHDQAHEGQHHATIVRFLREHGVSAVVTGHMGAPMVNTLHKLGVAPLVNASGDAREAALEAAAFIADGRASGASSQ